MKKMLTACAGLALVLGFSLSAAGCAEQREMKTMDSGMETMHRGPMSGGSMDKGMGGMEKPGMDKGMPMEEKKM